MNSLKRSRKKVDAEIMYEMRRQGMTNKQIAENLGVAVSTVYTTIGRLSESVKHAEVQGEPPVVDAPIVTEENAFLPFVKPDASNAPPCGPETALPALFGASSRGEGRGTEKAAFDRSEREIHHAGRIVPVRHRHQRRYCGDGGRCFHGIRYAGQNHHQAVHRGA